jgi:hypothetical protein
MAVRAENFPDPLAVVYRLARRGCVSFPLADAVEGRRRTAIFPALSRDDVNARFSKGSHQ